MISIRALVITAVGLILSAHSISAQDRCEPLYSPSTTTSCIKSSAATIGVARQV
jgi:hypothetical protein